MADEDWLPTFGAGTSGAVLVEGVVGGVVIPTNIAQWGGAATTLGQKVMASSVPVVIASDQTTLPVNNAQWGGVATTLGQKVMASSVPVVIASDQTPPYTIGGQGVTVIAVTGTAVALKASTVAKAVIIRARSANAGIIYFGASTVTNNEVAGTGGLQLSPGESIVVPVTNLNVLFINGTAADGVSYVYWT